MGKARVLFTVALFIVVPPALGADVAVLMSADVDAYREALHGFKQTLPHRIVAEYDMEGDFGRGQRIVREIVNEVKPDLILAVGLWALQVIQREGVDIPVTFSMVLNPPSVLREDIKNITGASMNVPVGEPLRLLKQLGDRVQRVGVVFNRAKTGYLVDRARAEARVQGLEIVMREVTSPKAATRAINALREEGVDAFWIWPDETVLDPKVVEYALLVSYRHGVPLLGLSERQAQMGALLSLSFGSSEDIGRQAGEIASGILRGHSPEELPYTTARELKLTVNLKAAEKLGLDIPQSLVAEADTVIQ